MGALHGSNENRTLLLLLPVVVVVDSTEKKDSAPVFRKLPSQARQSIRITEHLAAAAAAAAAMPGLEKRSRPDKRGHAICHTVMLFNWKMSVE